MYRILIVDDEPFIVGGLASLCADAEHLELEIYTAASSAQAMEWLRRVKIDIVLSDIKMPGLNGLMLQKEIEKQWPHCKVIFLTGYDDFDYIQEAFRAGSVDYILKTEGNDTVLLALERTLQLLDEERAMDSVLERAAEQTKKALPYLQKQYLMDLLEGDSVALKDLKRWFAEVEMELRFDRPCMLLICRVDQFRENTPTSRSLYLYMIQNVVEELLSPSISLMHLEYDRSKIVWLLQVKHDSSLEEDSKEQVQERAMRFIHGTLEQIQQVCKTLDHLKISLAAASEWVDWGQLPYSFERLKLLLSSGLGIGEESLLTGNPQQQTANEKDKPERMQLSEKRLNMLRSCLDNGEREDFDYTLSHMLSTSFRAEQTDHLFNMMLYYRLVSLYLPYISSIETYSARENGHLVDLDKLTRHDGHGSWNEAADYLQELTAVIFSTQEKGKDEQQHEVIKKVKLLIDEHLSGDLSLTHIGEAVGHNPSYLSRLYKQVTGEGLSEAINSARLGKAKQLLQETNDKVHEIAAAVGFVSPPYFYRFFKKATGITPQEYREMINT
ncbi:response regulator [Paenibacillus sepulcri]|uniref:Response regulator n=1 Tax=Paenibacillus sepulcri TaxID=359917 RepID=A0ABS7BWH4_9BACL|nr:response regulator [Paenibacillus sepulcri]